MTDKFHNVIFSVFEYGDFETLTMVAKKLNEELVLNGKAGFDNNAISISDYYNPEIGCHLPEKFTCWKSALYPDKIFFISNFEDGWHTLCRVFQKKLKCPWAMFEMSDPKSRCSMNMFFYSKEPGTERTVMSYYDDTHWVFYDNGEPIEIEDLNYYKARFKRDRINKDIVTEYMRRLGIKFYDIDKDITDCLNFIRTQW